MNRLAPWLAIVSLALVAALAVWGWVLHPDRAARWVVRIAALPVLLVLIDLRMPARPDRSREAVAILRWHRLVFAWLGVMAAVDLGGQLSVSAGLLDPAWDAPLTRVKGLLFGAGLAVWGNLLPTLLSPWSPRDEPFDWQRVHRFGGRVALLAGVLMVLVWLVFPLESARTLALWIAVSGTALMIGRKLVSVMSKPNLAGELRNR